MSKNYASTNVNMPNAKSKRLATVLAMALLTEGGFAQRSAAQADVDLRSATVGYWSDNSLRITAVTITPEFPSSGGRPVTVRLDASIEKGSGRWIGSPARSVSWRVRKYTGRFHPGWQFYQTSPSSGTAFFWCSRSGVYRVECTVRLLDQVATRVVDVLVLP